MSRVPFGLSYSSIIWRLNRALQYDDVRKVPSNNSSVMVSISVRLQKIVGVILVGVQWCSGAVVISCCSSLAWLLIGLLFLPELGVISQVLISGLFITAGGHCESVRS